MKKLKFGILIAAILPMALASCSARMSGRDTCAQTLKTAWAELDIAKVEGFAGSVSYSKALAALTYAKGQQQIERYPSCIEKAKRARFYIAQSRKGQ